MTIEELGQKTKVKYPQYNSKSDREVGEAILKQYPVYQSRIDGYEKPAPGPLSADNPQAADPKVAKARQDVADRLGKAIVEGKAKNEDTQKYETTYTRVMGKAFKPEDVFPVEQPKKENLLSKLGKSILNPFGKFAVSVGNTAAAASSLIKGEGTEVANKKLSQSRNLPFLGETEPVLKGDESFGEGAKKIIGSGLEIGSTVAGGGTAGQAGKAGLKGLIVQGAKQGAKGGLVSGAAQGAGDALSDGDSVGQALTEGAIGGVIGAATGGVAGGVLGKASSLFGKKTNIPINSVDDLVNKADDLLYNIPETSSPIKGNLNLKPKNNNVFKDSLGGSEILRKKAETAAPTVSLREKWAGIRPDIKKQIQGKQDQLKTYFNIAHARNQDANLPTPLEFAKRRAESARDQATNILNDTGTELGKFRAKIKTYQVPLEKVQKVVNSFDNELDKLNLQVKNRELSRIPGRVKKVSDSEVKLLQDFRENLNVIRQTPTVDSIIQNRIAADNNINFAKSAREASSAIDPISRKIRNELAGINREAVGRLESKTLEDYSNLSEFVEELNGYINRRAGGEFLLKRVLSERGAETRSLINTLKKYTGVDLLDDATMAQVATDLIGNVDQKGLFRKEITKAGLDAEALLRGDKIGAAKALLDYGISKIAEPEKMFLKAAGAKKLP